MAKFQFTQEQVAQGDAFGMKEGEDYVIVEGGGDAHEDDGENMDLDASALGFETEEDGGKPEASKSQEDEEVEDDKEEDDEEAEEDEEKEESEEETETEEDEEEPEEEVDAKADGEEDDAKGPLLPKFRYDQQRAKAERLAEENAKLQERLQALETAPKEPAKEDAKEEPAEPTREQTLLEEKLDDLLVKKNEALIDGDAKVAAKLEREMMGVQRDLDKLTAPAPKEQPERDPQTERDAIKAEILAEQQMDKALDNLIEEYDVLNDEKDTFDQKIVDRIVRLQRVGMSDGLSAVEAIVDAAETVLAGVKTNTELAAEAKEAEEKEDKPAPKKKKTDVKKNVDAAKKQPPSLDEDTGDDSDSAGLKDLPDIDKLTDEEFDKLPKNIQERMAGNYVH